ncbi:MAG: AAA family ATPase, partial [Lachnospiraceae bacterium]|nr:AAA family ATPase [Lachnospiraceae bacterium]
LISFMNSLIGKPKPLVSFSRPRRFGKSYDANMICAYYDKSCNSRFLFEDLKIAKDDSFERHLNQYNVITFDVTGFIADSKDNNTDIVLNIKNTLLEELRNAFPGCVDDGEKNLGKALYTVVSKGNAKFVFVIDEWDALFREYKEDKQLQEDYILFLRSLFKNKDTTSRSIAAAYMTGILPIKKYGTESALSDFEEFTMTEPLALSEYIGFTETEVLRLCEQYKADFDDVKQWYDGYRFENADSVYNPNSVIKAIKYKRIKNYWTSSETYESLAAYIGMDYKGLKKDVIRMLGGEAVRVRISKFQNDMTSFKSKDDVLTLLIHLGYLSYDAETKTVVIPNQEVADVFGDAVDGEGWEEIGELIQESDDLLDATLRGDSDAVAEALEKVHTANSSILRYNNEAALSSAIMIAYYTARRIYKIVPEFPQGKGFADLVFLPRRGSDKPVMIVELKYDKDADTAIRQIHENRYEGDLKKYFGNLLLVGINYDKDAKGADAKRHSCVIERV